MPFLLCSSLVRHPDDIGPPIDYHAPAGASQVPDLVPGSAPEYVGLMSSLPDTEYRNLLVTSDGAAARIVLNRPDKRNALSLELMEEMIAALRDVSASRDTRAIVIEGAGAAFSAGHDLSEIICHDR
jgi:hypothetical protein